jgi:AcrR family transcriptional regulator
VDGIASEIGMSRANVYRFVPSRDAINESPVLQCLGQRGDGELLVIAQDRERTARKFYRTRDDAKADVFDYIERFYKPRRRLDTGLSEPRGIRRAKPT